MIVKQESDLLIINYYESDYRQNWTTGSAVIPINQ